MEALSETSSSCNVWDNSFGPVVESSCRGGFDLTLLFEQIFLSIVPSALFMAMLPFRLASLYKVGRVAYPGRLCYIKLVRRSFFFFSLPFFFFSFLVFLSFFFFFCLSHPLQASLPGNFAPSRSALLPMWSSN